MATIAALRKENERLQDLSTDLRKQNEELKKQFEQLQDRCCFM